MIPGFVLCSPHSTVHCTAPAAHLSWWRLGVFVLCDAPKYCTLYSMVYSSHILYHNYQSRV
ncbi:hypothetical protein BDA96_01G440500 [Sorghum bicolor]|uniref:Uncharacterized protein n=1 Tax=Sorghum bicolor TaxID=4558 RepID=A0A921S4V1_SORBI|nr:hypothetical protein BDA96_01G440500 [Sorghum bicolor]